MALTAARTELNVSLVGEDETIRMLEDAKKRMGELEAKTRTLTGATKAQTDAAKAQQAATSGLNDTLGRMGGAIAKPLEGIGRLKEGINKGIEIFGFLGMGVNAAISAFNFLSDAFDDSEEEAAKLNAQLAEQKKQMDATKAAADRLSSSLKTMQAQSAAAAAGAQSDAIKLAQLTGDIQGAAKLQKEQEVQQATDAANKTRADLRALRKDSAQAQKDVQRFNEQSKREVDELMRKEDELKKARRSRDLDQVMVLKQEYDAALKRNDETQKALKLARSAVIQNETTTEELNKQLVLQDKMTEKLFDQYGAMSDITQEVQKQNEVKEKVEKPRGGGARRADAEDAAEAARLEQLTLRAEAEERGRVIKALYEEQKAREAVERQMREATETARVELFKTLPELQKSIQADLATLPMGTTFDAVRKQLAEQLQMVNEQMSGLRALAGLEDADLLAAATDKQVEALDKLQQAYLGVSEARAKAAEEAETMREALARALPAEVVNNFTTGLEQLSQIQAPVFEAVQESLAGVAAQMGKFKEGQTSLTAAIVGSASAIAGAVAKKVGGVKAEAGVRAAFEVAMGIATAFTNPAESVGHFAAATAFGLLAGGVIKPSGGGASGGQKAPAASAAATRESTMGGGGGTITNVYNLQTGIVDGQSTAMAFRRAEMTARNTGMASAGGW